MDAVVFSSAIRDDNQELERARELGITTFERHEFLRLVANCFDKVVGIAGSHGKTTVTAMLTHVLLKADENFVSMIGGEAIEFSNFVNNMGDGDGIFVTEACEYRRHMLALDVDVAVVLNTDWDHPDSYPTRESIEKAFAEFLRKAKVKVFESGVRSVPVRADETTTFEYETLGDYANVFEDGKFYPMFRAVPGEWEADPGDEELFLEFGKQTLTGRHPVLKRFLEHRIVTEDTVREQLKEAAVSGRRKPLLPGPSGGLRELCATPVDF